jgi:hypothetical protein
MFGDQRWWVSLAQTESASDTLTPTNTISLASHFTGI